MKLNAAPRIMLVAGLCAAGLIGLVVSEGAAREGGQEVLLPMEAVDPRALLSGHYVQLGITQRLAPTEACPAENDGAWVALRADGERYIAVGSATSRDNAQLLGLPVKGSLTCSPPTPPTPDAEGLPGWVTLQLGVDRFHVNQADAERIERVLRERNVNEATPAYAIVSIGRDGRARLKGLMLDGERLELSWL
jgi:hypothetical protein